VDTRPYEEVEAAVRGMAAEGRRLMFDPKLTNAALHEAAAGGALLRPSPLSLPKACKNSAELEGMQCAHLRDGAALANFFAWLTKHVQGGGALTEASLCRALQGFRAEQQGFLEPSFPTIAGSGPNGAIIHYSPEEAEREGADTATIDGSQMLLLDSGGQYDVGTTDVTRTLHLGKPSAWQRECFTRVLKGNIGLDTCVFPDKTPGPALDAFARAALWQAGLDYLHGTGHGVGAALNVHEGPMSISTRYHNTVGLRAGMVVSNEPGYYESGAFGIRIENLLVVRTRDAAYAGKPFLGFEPLTHVPIQQSLIAPELLSPQEEAWLDDYHQRVWERVSPLLERGSDGWEWLHRATRPFAQRPAEEGQPVAAAGA